MTLFLRKSAQLRPSTPTGSVSSWRSARSNKSQRSTTGSTKRLSGFSFRKDRRANVEEADNSGVGRSPVVGNTAARESDFLGDLEAEIEAMRDPPPQFNVRKIDYGAKPAVNRRGRGGRPRNTSSRRQHATQSQTCSALDFLDSWENSLMNCYTCGLNETITDFIFPVDVNNLRESNDQGERNGRQNNGLMQHSTRNHHMSNGNADHSRNRHIDNVEAFRMDYDV